jgi:hypothetical protein
MSRTTTKKYLFWDKYQSMIEELETIAKIKIGTLDIPLVFIYTTLFKRKTHHAS